MRRIKVSFGRESFAEQCAAGRYNPARTVEAGKVRFAISAGAGDSVEVFKEDGRFCVVTLNWRLGYVGLEIFDSSGARVGDVFLQSDEQVAESLGPGGLDLRASTIARRLAEYVY